MFLPDIPAMKAHAKFFENQYNALAASAFAGKAQQWAMQQKSDLGPPPVAPFRKLFTLDEQTFDIVESFSETERVIDLDPRSLLPKFGTDIDGSDSPVGTPIEGSPGKFHVSSWARPVNGELYPPKAPKYRYVHPPRTFFGYWEEIA
jgi:hypothetical protein